jgi:flagellar biosynthesis/type III secretory pathway protein FliH
MEQPPPLALLEGRIMATQSNPSETAKALNNQAVNLSEFVVELIAPFSIHRKKYARPHGTVARRQFASRAEKRLNWLVEQARREGYKAGYSQGQVDFEGRIGAEGSDLVRLSHNVSTDVANPSKAQESATTGEME